MARPHLPAGVGVEPDWLERLRRWARLGALGRYDGRLFLRWPALAPRAWGRPAGELLCLRTLPIRLFAHQRRAVERVLFVMGGRALLADEVGLGKTIEAGTVLKELWLRGLVRRALILAPAALVRQWQLELERHLGLTACVHPADHGWDRPEVVLTSLEWARMADHAPAVQARPWDLVIVDEAHRLKNRASAGFRLVAGLEKGYLLLLTATPVHNDLLELYNLVSLLRPGQLGTPGSFRREFTAGPRAVRNAERLRRLVAEVMVRTRRAEAGLALPARRVQVCRTPFTADEAALYTEALECLRELAASGDATVRLVMAVVLREAASSPRACAATLARLARGALAAKQPSMRARLAQLAERARALARRSPGPKVRWLLRRFARRRPAGAGQLVCFTQFASTARTAAAWLRRWGVAAGVLCGALSERERQEVLQAFRSHLPVLVSTDVGSEGYNLQFCRRLVNLDLPWNPMRIEQRIGRLHRLGQQHAVQVVHLVVPGTIEEDVMQLVYEKLGMFREAVGDLDEVVAAVPGGLTARIAGAVVGARSRKEVRGALQELGEELARRIERQRQAEALTARVLDAPEMTRSRVGSAS